MEPNSGLFVFSFFITLFVHYSMGAISKVNKTKIQSIDVLPDAIYKQIWENMLQSDFEVRYYSELVRLCGDIDQKIRVLLFFATAGVSSLAFLKSYPAILTGCASFATLLSGVQNV